MEKLKIGISIGDINGVGLEVILKNLSNPNMAKMATFIIYGSSKVVSYHKNIVDVNLHYHQAQNIDRIHRDKVNVINCWSENVNITLGKATEDGGKYAVQSLEAATNDLRHGLIDALVTAPINKGAMQMANFPFPGHTEYITEKLDAKDSLMFMVHDDLKIALVTNHLPIGDVKRKINKGLIISKIRMLNDCLKMDFGLDRPTIAVLGLNPHAGDGGAIGKEDDEMVRPAIVELKKKGLMVMGPYPADGFFGSGQYKKFDAVLAMYHDQGLVPFKLLSFGEGVNFTAGLTGVRTSPDHGTAFDIAGQNMASEVSFRKAIFSAIDFVKNRKEHFENHANPLVRVPPKKGKPKKRQSNKREEEE
ncbi:MAG: 4-hydroxythreonine-4-phosphate dehydrogenase PdxA [Bacteroidota bacterium]